MQPNRIYFNEAQLTTQLIAANTTVIVAGRRTGKTDSIAAPFVLRCIQRMPGSTGGIVVPTYRHGLTNTVPGIFTALRRWGYREGVHFCIGKVPPAHFRAPLVKPFSYERVISFYNGSLAVLLSQDRAGTANGLTLSWLLIDEAKFIDYRKLKEETLPANGGIKSFFGRHACNHAMMILSDMPQTKSGSWFLGYEKKMDREVIELIKGSLVEWWDLSARIRAAEAGGGKADPNLWQRLRDTDRELNRLRSVATYYREYSTLENLQLVGEKYIRQMKRDLPPLTFQTSIMCRRIGMTRDGFYSCMSDAHLYDADDMERLDGMGFEVDPASLDSGIDLDHDPDAPICIGMDYNANINWIVAGQIHGTRLDVMKSFYVKYERKLPELVGDFCSYYSRQRRKEVVFYYDSTALGRNAVNNTTYFSVVTEAFRERGWKVTPVYLGHPMAHDRKHLLINQAFKGRATLTPYINRQNNEPLVLAMQTAGVVSNHLGFRKDKSGEKLAESEEDPLEYRTDGTDAFDTLFIGCETRPPATGKGTFYFSGIM